MKKSELDKEFIDNYEKFVTVARGLCMKNKRRYTPYECLSYLYLHLSSKVEEIYVEGFYSYSVKWLRQQITWSRSEINLQEIKFIDYFDTPLLIEEEEGIGSEIDKLKARINEEKEGVKDRVNYLFLTDLAGEKDYTKKTISEYYGISSRSIELLIRSSRSELRELKTIK